MQTTTVPQDAYFTPVSNLDILLTSTGDDSEPTIFPDGCLPSDDVIAELVDIFFNQLYFVLPCFHRDTFMEEFQSGRMQAQSPLLIYSMLSVAAGFHNDRSIKARRTEWYEQAKFLYDFTGRDPHPALRTIQAVVFLVYHAYTCGDFSACWLYIGKAWRQAAALGMNRMDSEHAVIMPVGLKDGMKSERRGYYNRLEWEGRTAIEKEECRRVLWILFFMDRNQSWPTGWPSAIDERQFKLDIPVADSIFQAMRPETNPNDIVNVPFTRNVSRLLTTASHAKTPLNMFHYLIIAYILLGRTADLIHSIHDNPSSPEYAEECEELDNCVLKLRLSMPRAASSVLEAAPEDRGQVVWLDATLNTIMLLLHYRAIPFSDPQVVKDIFSKTVIAAKSTSQTIKDASRTSIDLLFNVHIASSLYMACCVLVIHHRLEDDTSLKNDIDFLELVFERMNDVFSVIGLKFTIALKRDRERNREELLSLRERGYRGLLADCSKWGFVKDEVMKLGMTMS
ncbi:hypothetical protein P171DRAFT_364597 [Karstenula rhodostoma CBS 690.94]|uniref:Xylanolytic transcriptional activator regulatory domain-containing protein n=1 Tax=Karstenula rhodostoma CBS 690.94 TaxID=1392251 RepID=A0A9P4PFS6_9PLEO|nr:hypothetical protein P171DRAFT_364597 [Karstenula rhodostoma CBS 690.94]